MENIKIIILYSISLFLIHIIKKCSCQTNIYQEKYFTLLAYGTDNQLIQKFDLEYNYTTKFFNKHEEISNMYVYIQYLFNINHCKYILCIKN